MAKKEPTREIILRTLREKSTVKQDIFANTCKTFDLFKKEAKACVDDVSDHITKHDPRITILYEQKSDYEFHVKIAGDILVFFMHTNVFNFDRSHQMWKTSYLREDESRSYCGIISIYNFLSDSFKYQRVNDIGYLIARIFVNKDGHFFLEGKRQLGFLYNDFQHDEINNQSVKDILESSLLYTLDFDLLTPPYDNMKEISLQEIMDAGATAKIKTGKRLGFKFSADNDDINA